MNNIQFDFNPLSSNPLGRSKFPWSIVLLGLGLVCVILYYSFEKNKKGNRFGLEKEMKENQET